jgi:hypothetical protein
VITIVRHNVKNIKLVVLPRNPDKENEEELGCLPVGDIEKEEKTHTITV